MTRTGRGLLAAVAVVAGGVAAWAGAEGWRQHLVGEDVVGAQLNITGGPYTAEEPVQIDVTASWSNGNPGQVQYGVQGAILNAGVVAGHLWLTMGEAQQWAAAYAAGQTSQAAAAAAAAASRVALLAAEGEGGSARATLYGYPTYLGGQTVLVWVQPNPPTNALLVSDPLGKLGSRLILATAATISQPLG